MEKLGFEMLKLTNKYKNKINLIYKAFRQDEYQIFGEQFVINNKDNIELIINGQANSLIHKCYLKEGDNIITIIIKNKLKNLSRMFTSCKCLKNIDELEFLDVSGVTDFSYMFSECNSLTNIDSLRYWDVSNTIKNK